MQAGRPLLLLPTPPLLQQLLLLSRQTSPMARARVHLITRTFVHLIARTRKHLTALQVKRGGSQQVGRAVCGRAHLRVWFDLFKLELVQFDLDQGDGDKESLSEVQPGQHRAVDDECPSCSCGTLPSPSPSCSACPLSGLLKSGMDGRSSSPHLTLKFSLKHQTPLFQGQLSGTLWMVVPTTGLSTQLSAAVAAALGAVSSFHCRRRRRGWLR